MYQVKFQNGYEIQAIGRGEKGLCRVVNSQGREVKRGVYAACSFWLRSRRVRPI